MSPAKSAEPLKFAEISEIMLKKKKHPRPRKNKISTSTPTPSPNPPPPPRKNEEFYGNVDFPAEIIKKSQVPIKLAQPFPAPELQAEKLWTWGLLWSKVQTVRWEAGKEGAAETGVKRGLKRQHKPWTRAKIAHKPWISEVLNREVQAVKSAFSPRVCKRWFPNGGSSSVGERNSATPFSPQFNPFLPQPYLILTSFKPKFCLNLTSAQPRFGNHGLHTLGFSLQNSSVSVHNVHFMFMV